MKLINKEIRPVTGIRTCLLSGVRFNPLTIHEAVETIDRFVQSRIPRQVSFSNAYTVYLAKKEPYIQKIINSSDLNLADGMSIVWAGRQIGLDFPERVAGPDLMEALCERAAQKGHRLYLLGSSDKTLSDLESSLYGKFPNLKIVGKQSPPYKEQYTKEETEIIIKQLQETNPDILFVGISCPKQEIWIGENLNNINVPVCLGVGAAFDFLSGQIPRAPEFLRSIGLEWLYRLYREPRRLWKRYLLGNLAFLSLVWAGILKRKVTSSVNEAHT